MRWAVGWHTPHSGNVEGLVYDTLVAAEDQFRHLDGGSYASRLYVYNQAAHNIAILKEYGSSYTFSQHSHLFATWAQTKLCSSACPCTNYSLPPATSWPPAPSLNCSGCSCTPSAGEVSGTLSDGSSPDALYEKNLNCAWLLAGPSISLVFTSFATESYWDPVTVNRCSDAACRSCRTTLLFVPAFSSGLASLAIEHARSHK